MYPEKLKKYQIVLASQSPRRQFLLKELGLDVRVVVNADIEEEFPAHLSKEQIPVYLAELKSTHFKDKLGDLDILITADTIVWLNGEVLGKPKDREDAIAILKKLSGGMHEVITGVCLKLRNKTRTFISVSKVYFRPLAYEEIVYYVDNYLPFDKAGAYGVQEWIGYIGIEKIMGSYFNVMGLPIQKLYMELLHIIEQ